jgi:hypothetical protein
MISVVLVFSFFAVFSQAAETSIYPIADTYISSLLLARNLNFGTLGLASAFKDGLTDYNLLVQFNISTLPVTTTSVVLVFKQETEEVGEALLGPYIAFTVYELANNWTETGVTWNNPPVTLSSVYTTPYQDDNIDYVLAPVTSICLSYRNLAKNVISFSLHSDDPYVNVYTKETPYSTYKPHLHVTYI